jgi:hypothetical protein
MAISSSDVISDTFYLGLKKERFAYGGAMVLAVSAGRSKPRPYKFVPCNSAEKSFELNKLSYFDFGLLVRTHR